jgi:hypothetical protein
MNCDICLLRLFCTHEDCEAEAEIGLDEDFDDPDTEDDEPLSIFTWAEFSYNRLLENSNRWDSRNFEPTEEEMYAEELLELLY